MDTSQFPQDAIDLIELIQDDLEDHHIYPEYSPYLGLRAIDPLPRTTDDPRVNYILSLCHDTKEDSDGWLEV